MGDKKHSAFGKRLDSLRNSGERKQDFAARLGIPRTNLPKYYQGRIPDSLILERISRASGVNIDWLVTGEEPKFKADVVIQDTIDRIYSPLDHNQETENGPPIVRNPAAVAKIISSVINQAELDPDTRGRLSELVVDLLTNPPLRDQVFEYYLFARRKKH